MSTLKICDSYFVVRSTFILLKELFFLLDETINFGENYCNTTTFYPMSILKIYHSYFWLYQLSLFEEHFLSNFRKGAFLSGPNDDLAKVVKIDKNDLKCIIPYIVPRKKKAVSLVNVSVGNLLRYNEFQVYLTRTNFGLGI